MADNASPKPTNVNTEAAAPPPASAPEVPSAFSLFKPSWEGLKLNIVELIVLFLVPTAVLALYFLIAASAIGATSSGGINAAGVILIIIGVAVTAVFAALIGPAFIHIQLRSARMEKATYQSAWETSKKFWWRYLLVSIAVGLTIGIGFLLLIIPGIIFLRRYFLSQYALIDQDLGVGESMKRSNQLSRGRSMAIFGIIGVDILISLPNVIPVIGGLITFVLQIAYFCAPAIRYDQLKALKPVAAKN